MLCVTVLLKSKHIFRSQPSKGGVVGMEESSTLDRKSSIEEEPRAINIDFAREQAMYVVNTTSVEEALTIFTKGLQPVSCCGRAAEAAGVTDITNMDQLDSPRMLDLRKFASAPF